MSQPMDSEVGDSRPGSSSLDRRIPEGSPPRLTSLNDDAHAARVPEEKIVVPKTQDHQLTSNCTSLEICPASSSFPEATNDVSRKRKNSEDSPETGKTQDLRSMYMAPQESNSSQKAKRQSWRRSSMKETNRRKSLPPFHQGITELSRSISTDLAESKRLGCLLLSSFQFSAQKLEPFLKDVDSISLDAFKARVSSISEEFKHFTNRLEDDGTLKKCSDESKGRKDAKSVKIKKNKDNMKFKKLGASYGQVCLMEQKNMLYQGKKWFIETIFKCTEEKEVECEARISQDSFEDIMQSTDTALEASMAEIKEYIARLSSECTKWDQLLLHHQKEAEEISRTLEETKITDIELDPALYLQSSQSEILSTKPDYQKILDSQNEVFNCMEIVIDELQGSVRLLSSFMEDTTQFFKRVSLQLGERTTQQLETSPIRKLLKPQLEKPSLTH